MARLRILLCVLLIAGLAGSVACARTETATITVQGVDRHFRVYRPGHLPQPAPLLVALHGGGGNARKAQRSYRFDRLADREGFLVVYPDALEGHWHDGRTDAVFKGQKGDDLAFMAALLDHMEQNYPVDPARIYFTGASNGAMMSHYVAMELSDRVAAIAPVIGSITEEAAPSFGPTDPVAVLIIQGEEDPLVPYNGGHVTVLGKKRGRVLSTDRTVEMWVKHNGCRPDGPPTKLADVDPKDGCQTTVTRYTGGRRGGTEVVLYSIAGGGHTWPGGFQYLPEKLVGKVCRDFKASELIWEFFEAHHK